MRLSTITRHRAGTTFVFIFFVVFLLCCALLVPRILSVYDGILQRSDSIHHITTPFQYLTGAIRRGDCAQSIHITTLQDGTSALSIVQDDTTWLYYTKEGYLYQQNARKSERSAERLCASNNIRFLSENGMITAELLQADSNVKILQLTPRSGLVGGAT